MTISSIATAQISQPLPETYLWQDEPIGLYLHIPFCQSKCIYCDFNSYARMEGRYSAFAEALCADIRGGITRGVRGVPDDSGVTVSTIFFGGGTPSVLSPEQIGQILDAVRERYKVADDAEITMEANPGKISLDHFKGYLNAGVNRLSMGVQVLDDLMLKKLGRIHTSEGAIESYRLAHEAGFSNINLDFIIGLPGQDLRHLEDVLDRLLGVSPLPEHLSVYTLIVEEHTPLYVGVMRGLIQVPDDDEVAAMYERVSERLSDDGYRQYEVSNWTLGAECRHNLVYWQGGRYLAFGPGAHGYWGETRYNTVLSPDDYIRRVQSGESPILESEAIDVRTEMGEFMMVGLRLNKGVSLRQFAGRFRCGLVEAFPGELARLRAQGLVEIVGDRVRLTEAGRLLGNEAFGAFLL